MSKTSQSQWNQAVGWYSQIMGETGDELNSQIIRPTLLEMLGDLQGKKILDVGCGSGYLTVELAQTAQAVTGTDFSTKFIELCEEKYAAQTNLDFQVQDVAQALQFSNDSFDLILSKMVLQYVEDISTFARESYRTLKKNGQLLVVVDHPFHRQFYFAQSLAGKTGPNFEGLNDYFSNDPQTKLKTTAAGEKIELTWFPKTISEYILPFIQAGLMLTNMREVKEDKEGTTIPRILFLEFRKN
jgi:ubiquinone/menaquinone biosynthesis C-methylase UbiE